MYCILVMNVQIILHGNTLLHILLKNLFKYPSKVTKCRICYNILHLLHTYIHTYTHTYYVLSCHVVMELVLDGEVVARGNITAQTTVHGERVESHESAVMLVETCIRAPPGYSQAAFCTGSFIKMANRRHKIAKYECM